MNESEYQKQLDDNISFAMEELDNARLPGPKCTECPYYSFTSFLRDMLKSYVMEYRPRLLRLDEIHRGMAVWIEFRNKPKWLAYVDDDETNAKRVMLAIGGSSVRYTKCFVTEDDMSIGLNDCDYNVTWRAWTGEPTKEQMDSEEWNKKEERQDAL